MHFTDVDLSAFPREREEKLRSITRFSLFEIMLYRTNLWQHALRVHWITEELVPLAQSLSLDPQKARVLALVHDDAEILTGDYQAGHKAKMSKEQLAQLDEEEELAVQKLAARYPKTIHGYDYAALLRHAIHKDCIEAQLVSYADRIDAYNETLHEVLAGNASFLWSLMFYEKSFAHVREKYPLLEPLIAHRSPFIFGNDNRFQPDHVFAKAFRGLLKPHTPESIGEPTDFTFYNAWRDMIQKRAGDEGVRWLTEQKEFLPF